MESDETQESVSIKQNRNRNTNHRSEDTGISQLPSAEKVGRENLMTVCKCNKNSEGRRARGRGRPEVEERAQGLPAGFRLRFGVMVTDGEKMVPLAAFRS